MKSRGWKVLGKKFRRYGTFDEPLFLAKDVAKWFDYDTNKVGQMLRTEDGVYEVLMQSHKPIAKTFKKQVKELLKPLRKAGAYVSPNAQPLDSNDYISTLMDKTMAPASVAQEKRLEVKM